MVTVSEMIGRPVWGVMVCRPVPLMLKEMTSAPTWPLALMMAWRSEPAPLLAVLVTVKVLARDADALSSRHTAARTPAEPRFLVTTDPASRVHMFMAPLSRGLGDSRQRQ